MRVVSSIALAGILAFCVVPPAVAGGAPAQFLAGFDDLPLMPALTQDVDRVTVFESPYGRIAESTASGRTTRAAVLAFYGATLPQLGWVRASDTLFRREGEELTLDITDSGGAVTVRFLVSPDG